VFVCRTTKPLTEADAALLDKFVLELHNRAVHSDATL
jgi:hypothetical protein